MQSVTLVRVFFFSFFLSPDILPHLEMIKPIVFLQTNVHPGPSTDDPNACTTYLHILYMLWRAGASEGYLE